MNLNNRKRQVFLATVSAVLVIGIIELTLSLLAYVFPRVDWLLASPWIQGAISPTVPDDRLFVRPNPAYPGHDRNGFRNPSVPEHPAIVALGDSQTYGVGVDAGAAWPRVLASLTGTTVYSIAFGGYGPVHYLILWDEAAAMRPQIVIEAFYAGNDLYDAFNLVYNHGQFPELKSSDPRLQARIRELEQSEPIWEHVTRLHHMGRIPAEVEEAETNGDRSGYSPLRVLSQHSKIYGVFRRIWYEGRRLAHQLEQTPEKNWERAKAIADAHSAYRQAFSDGQVKTVFTSEYRLAALNLGDPRISEGLQISLRAMRRMHEEAVARNIRFLVVIIPTKEAVFNLLWKNPSKSFRSLTENEARVWKTIKDFLGKNGIEYLDALPALREQLSTGIQPYQVSDDGHPNAQGHQVIAKLIAAHLEAGKK